MRFRPCIDIHNGKVKQIVGSTLKDQGDQAQENFTSERSAADFAGLYRDYSLKGGHVILLNRSDSPYYPETLSQALAALHAAPGLLQAGGGITPENAAMFLDAGASHVIVTSYVFSDGKMNRDRLKEMISAVGKERLVLDLSCACRDGELRIMTDRWQKASGECLGIPLLEELSGCCSEILVHAVDVEGKSEGPQEDVLNILGSFAALPCVYAGGIRSMEDIRRVRILGRGHVDFTVGSALDLFGGSLPFETLASLES